MLLIIEGIIYTVPGTIIGIFFFIKKNFFFNEGLIMTYWLSAFTEYFIYDGNNLSFGFELN